MKRGWEVISTVVTYVTIFRATVSTPWYNTSMLQCKGFLW